MLINKTIELEPVTKCNINKNDPSAVFAEVSSIQILEGPKNTATVGPRLDN